ncbi:MAG TPA: choice-of-anchor Q domain-containing protein [Anaerolineae bacterium]|nr:choice-of-anchor Q domain-containing protein [Anaerolineae bacterium]HQI85333.1 choice-of-anchor Q domain-containing protein [Anaerolineae bacterium]
MKRYVSPKLWLLTAAIGLVMVAGALLPWGATRAHSAALSGAIIYVDASAPGPDHDGLSWTTAFTEVQSALSVAVSGDQIWVAEGVYKPDFDPDLGAYTGNITATFALTNGVQLYGGFSGAMNTLTERLPHVYLTVFSGDLEGDDQTDARHLITDTAYISGTNVYHVVTAVGVNNTAVLDGFFITGGQASGVAPDSYGGGMRNENANPRVANVTFIGNWANSGGGMRNDSASPVLDEVTFIANWASSGGGMANFAGSHPTLSHVVFDGNQVVGGGGGMMNRDASQPVLFDVTFIGNRASFGGGMVNWEDCHARLTNATFRSNVATTVGGGIENIRSNPTLINVALSGNRADLYGGAMENLQSAPNLVNVTFHGNVAGVSGGGIYNETNSAPLLHNSILWGNMDSTGTATAGAQVSNVTDSIPVIRYTLIQGSGGSGAAWVPALGVDGGGNLDADPQFIAPVDAATAPTSAGNLRLTFGSPAMDAGNNAAVLSAVDLDGKPRIVDPAVDMGAYEVEGICFAAVGSADTVQIVYNSTTARAVQRAVDAASAGQTVRVAGHCISLEVAQTVYITKSLTLRGGYASGDWAASLPLTQPTTLDASGEGRVVYIVGPASVALENLRLINGLLQNINSRGAAVRVDNATAAISGCEIISNTAPGGGGGLAFTGSSSGRVVNTLLARNTSGSGAALWTNASGVINMVHTTIAAPTLNPGSAIYVNGGTMHLINVLIANHAFGVV